MKHLKIFEDFEYKSITPDELKGLVVKRIYHSSNGSSIVETDKGIFDVGCMGGAMISFEGSLSIEEVVNRTIIDVLMEEGSITLVFSDGEISFVDDTGGEGVSADWVNESNDSKIEDIELKIKDAAYSLKTFGTMNKQGAFINGAKWAIHNLTDEEIKYMRESSDSEDHSFFGL